MNGITLLALTVVAALSAGAAAAQDATAGHGMAAMGQTMTGMDPDMKMMGGGAMVAATSPKDGEISKDSPTAFSITFAHPMLLTQIRLVNDAGESIPTGFEPGTKDALQAGARLPQLQPGHYELHWVAAMGAANAKGVVRFTVQ